ncbi:rhomboid family intramembrane serine protease [Antarcticimicrobium luteum]|uniref:Rhomboid family intramembrane serine protease n=1 Tax=Antarcticimicrobium luteum TaxID=2547397 RepID=A0A4R5VIH6_9RHOB|nr:rhomboid family intramembrane serine protease [Antarcticimicrobium luteum]TDK52644.1 rhomboid family intramembrane serine protease [Antarcticimicrobium luteum]
MLPIRDHNPSGRTPFVVYALMAVNIGVFLTYVGQPEQQVFQNVFLDWALIPARLSQGSGFETLLTSTFLHGGLMHLAGNMLFLWIFGDNLEDEMGHLGFTLFYLACAVGAGLIHTLAAPLSPVPTVGASGAIAGVMGAYLLLFPKARVDILIILVVFVRILAIPAWLMLGLWLIFQFLGGLGADPNGGGVAYWAHAGGFFVGFALTVPLWMRRGGPRFWSRTHGQPPHPEARYKLSPSHIPKVPRR